jgi:hypothetical protein
MTSRFSYDERGNVVDHGPPSRRDSTFEEERDRVKKELKECAKILAIGGGVVAILRIIRGLLYG